MSSNINNPSLPSPAYIIKERSAMGGKGLLGVGACHMDTILTVGHYPIEDEKLRASSMIRRRGGNCCNTFEVLEQLLKIDEEASFPLLLSVVLPSTSSTAIRQIKDSFAPSTIDLTHCIYREECSEPITSYIIRNSSSDSRTSVSHNKLPEMSSEEFMVIADEVGDKIAWCHFQPRIPAVTLECMHHLRKRFPTVKISVELEQPGRNGLQDLAAEADVVFYSKAWAQANGYKTAKVCLQEQAKLTSKASVLCCTWGSEGASALQLPDNIDSRSISPPVSVVDTIGAGDTFIAGMLYGLTCHVNDWDLERKLYWANKLAGRKVEQEGLSGLGDYMLQEARMCSSFGETEEEAFDRLWN